MERAQASLEAFTGVYLSLGVIHSPLKYSNLPLFCVKNTKEKNLKSIFLEMLTYGEYSYIKDVCKLKNVGKFGDLILLEYK